MATQECKELKEDDWSSSCCYEFLICCLGADGNEYTREYYSGKQNHNQLEKDCEASKTGAPKARQFTNLRY